MVKVINKEDKKIFAEINNLHKKIGKQEILKGIDLKIYEGETLVLLGSSGGGKSVLLRHIIGLMEPDVGSIKIEGNEITTLSEYKMQSIRKKIGILFQHGALFDGMTVEENVAFPLVESGIKDNQKIKDLVNEALRVVDLEEHGHKLPITLSGGMRKRVALARAVVTRPHCVLYDEPTSGLDPVVTDSINKLIRRLQSRYNITSVVISHDIKSVFYIADRIAFLKNGTIYYCDEVENFKTNKDPEILNFINGISSIEV